MKNLIIIVLILSGISLKSQNNPLYRTFYTQDHVNHIIISTGITGMSYAIYKTSLPAQKKNKWVALGCASLTSFGMGVFYEHVQKWDKKPETVFSRHDLKADAMGVIMFDAGFLVVEGVKLIFRKKQKEDRVMYKNNE